MTPEQAEVRGKGAQRRARIHEARKRDIRQALFGMRNTPMRELLHEMIIEVSMGVDD